MQDYSLHFNYSWRFWLSHTYLPGAHASHPFARYSLVGGGSLCLECNTAHLLPTEKVTPKKSFFKLCLDLTSHSVKGRGTCIWYILHIQHPLYCSHLHFPEISVFPQRVFNFLFFFIPNWNRKKLIFWKSSAQWGRSGYIGHISDIFNNVFYV